jgi:hypothetical protein
LSLLLLIAIVVASFPRTDSVAFTDAGNGAGAVPVLLAFAVAVTDTDAVPVPVPVAVDGQSAPGPT